MRAKTYSLTHATRQSLRKDTQTTRPSRGSTLPISGFPNFFFYL